MTPEPHAIGVHGVWCNDDTTAFELFCTCGWSHQWAGDATLSDMSTVATEHVANATTGEVLPQ